MGAQDEELAQGDALALADERTWRLPASGWAIFINSVALSIEFFNYVIIIKVPS